MSVPGFWQRAGVWHQYALPQQALTAMANRISTARSRWIHGPLIRGFTRLYPVDRGEAVEPEGGYRSFDEFFTRALKPGARAFPDNPETVVSPSDGTLSQRGQIESGRMLQAKGRTFSADTLIGDAELARPFSGGRFATIYLAPHDYHRVHMPATGTLHTEVRIPGRLFSVSDRTSRVIDGLYARNERMVALFDTDRGPLAVVMVAAMLVAGIETAWGGPGNLRPERALRIHPARAPLTLERGAELGRFHWGSTVVVLTGPDFPDWSDTLAPGRPVRLGQAMSG